MTDSIKVFYWINTQDKDKIRCAFFTENHRPMKAQVTCYGCGGEWE